MDSTEKQKVEKTVEDDQHEGKQTGQTEHGQEEQQQQTDSDKLLEQSQATNEKSGKADDGQSSTQEVSGHVESESEIVQSKVTTNEESKEDEEKAGETAEKEEKGKAEASGSEETKAEEDADGELTDQKEEEQVKTDAAQTQPEPEVKLSFYDLLEQQLDTAALTAKFDSSVVSSISTWGAQVELTHEQNDNITQKFLSAFDAIHLAADDEQLVELLVLAKKFTDHFGLLHKDLFMAALCKKYTEMKDNSFQALDRHFIDFPAELTDLIRNLPDHQTVNKDKGRVDQDRDKLYWLLLLNPPEVLYRLLSHSLVNSGIVTVVNKILAHFPSLFALCTVNRETTRPFNEEPLLISVIWRIFEADPERWKREEQCTNFIYMVQSLTKQFRVEHNSKQPVSFDSSCMPPSPLLFPTDLYCLFVQQIVISNTNHLGIVLKLLHKLFQNKHGQLANFVWANQLNSENDGSEMCTPELVSCLLDVLSDTSDENYELWAEARNILQLFGHKLTAEDVVFDAEARDFLLDKLNSFPWWIKLVMVMWFSVPLNNPKVQLPPTIFLTQHTLYQENSEKIALDFAASLGEDFLRGLFELGLFDEHFALDLMERGMLQRPTDPHLTTKIASALVDTVTENSSTAARITKLTPLLCKLIQLLDSQVNIPRAVEQTVTAAIFAGLAKSTHLIVLAQAAKIALLMVEQNPQEEDHRKAVALAFVQAFCVATKEHFDVEMDILRRADREERDAALNDPESAKKLQEKTKREKEKEKEGGKEEEQSTKTAKGKKKKDDRDSQKEKGILLVKQRLENFDLVESLNVQVRKVFMDTLIITQVLEDLKMPPPFALRTLLNYVVDQLHVIEHRPVTKAIELLEKEPEKNQKVFYGYAKANVPRAAREAEERQMRELTAGLRRKSFDSIPFPQAPPPSIPATLFGSTQNPVMPKTSGVLNTAATSISPSLNTNPPDKTGNIEQDKAENTPYNQNQSQEDRSSARSSISKYSDVDNRPNKIVPGGYLKRPSEVTITRLPLVNPASASSSTNMAKVQPFRSGYDRPQFEVPGSDPGQGQSSDWDSPRNEDRPRHFEPRNDNFSNRNSNSNWQGGATSDRRYEGNDRRNFGRGGANWGDNYNQGYQSRAGGQHHRANERYNRGRTDKNYSNSNWGYSNQKKDYENPSTYKNYSNQPSSYSNSTPNDKDYTNDPYNEDPYYSNLRNSNSNDNYSNNQYNRYCSEQEGPSDYYENREDSYDGDRDNRSSSRVPSGGGHRVQTFTSKNFASNCQDYSPPDANRDRQGSGNDRDREGVDGYSQVDARAPRHQDNAYRDDWCKNCSHYDNKSQPVMETEWNGSDHAQHGQRYGQEGQDEQYNYDQTQDRRSRNDHLAPHSTHHLSPQSHFHHSDQPHPGHYARNPSPRSAYEPFDDDGTFQGDRPHSSTGGGGMGRNQGGSSNYGPQKSSPRGNHQQQYGEGHKFGAAWSDRARGREHRGNGGSRRGDYRN
ncbi:hypothetical protein WR25_21356 [Diploscapter pachys]|uniref:Edg1 TPR repeats region domain-containing protein n=1 Tax=Diploscapter pachys TaxID=2018661 RepID=A0A2A2KQT1_9BILA|nr:hypothetical protein WR25_21356 [Diploscapter pachys]